jgi:hypothetical protein
VLREIFGGEMEKLNRRKEKITVDFMRMGILVDVRRLG